MPRVTPSVRVHGDGAHLVAPDVLRHLADEIVHGSVIVLPGEGERVVDLRQMFRLELGVDRGSDDLHDLADASFRRSFRHV